MPKISSIILFIVLFSSVYQNFPLVERLGEIARSPIIFTVPLMLVVLFNNSKLFISKHTKQFGAYIMYLVLISILYTILFYIHLDSLHYLNENVLVKTIKMVLYPITSLIVYIYIYNYLKNSSSIRTLAMQVYSIQLILLTILIVQVFYNNEGYTFLDFLHAGNEPYWRIRLLTLEASWSGLVAVIFFLLPLYFLKEGILTNKIIVITSISFIVLFSVTSQSKGYLSLFLVSFLPSLYKVLKKSIYKSYIYTGTIILIIVGIVSSSLLYTQVTEQFYTSITFGTRFTSYISSLYTFIKNPFGVGLGPYLLYYTKSIKDIIESGIMSSFNLNEITNYLTTSKSLSTKTFFFDQLMFGGLWFLYFFYKFFYLRIRELSKDESFTYLRVILIFIILSGMSYITFHIKYEVWIFLAIIDYIINKNRLNENTDSI